MNECEHEESVEVYLTGYYDSWGDWVEPDYKWEVRSTCVDIDLHRYKCHKCGEVGYYSHKARLFYEEGIEDPYIKGLSK